MNTKMIVRLADNQFFVAGTNYAGNHAGGAAFYAYEHFGLKFGIAEGLCGKTYAFPTLESDMNKRGMRGLIKSRDRFFETARALPEKQFVMSAVGTGIAGYEIGEMKILFENPPVNVVLPDWENKIN